MNPVMVVRGGHHVGGSCLDYYAKRGARLTFDLGLELGKGGVPQLPKMVDYHGDNHLVITHGHVDHCGALGFVDEGTHIYGTPATKKLCEIMLRDSSAVNRRKGQWDFVFEQHEVEAILDNQFEALEFDRTITLDDGLTMSLWPAGHVLGAAMPYVVDHGVRILHTGNFSWTDQRLIAGAKLLQSSVDVLVLDATYGSRNHEPIEDARRALLDLIVETIKKGGKVLIPTFAFGRFQELLQIISDLKRAELIPSSVPVYADGGLAMSITEVYYENLKSLRWESITDNPFAPYQAVSPKVKALTRSQRLKMMFPYVNFLEDDVERERMLKESKSSITVVGSGMVVSPIAVKYVSAYAEVPDNMIIMTGFVAEDTNAFQILGSSRDGMLTLKTPDSGDIRLTRRCDVKRVSFSAHAGQSELVEVTRRLRPRMTLLVHGGEQEKIVLRAKLNEAGIGGQVVIPVPGEEIEVTNQLMAA